MDVFPWVPTIRKIGTGDAKTRLATWSDKYTTKGFRLGGNKRMALMTLLDAPRDGVQLILDQISRLGIEGAVANEECMSAKHIYPCHVWRQSQLPVWARMLRVSDESFTFMCRLMVERYERKLPSLRQKVTKSQIEELSQVAALAVSLADVVVKEHAISPAKAQAFLNQVVADDSVLMELQTHMHEKQATFTALDVVALNDLVKATRQQSDTMILAQGGQAPDTMLVAAGELEDKEWALVLDKLNHDKALVTAYVNKSQDAASFSFHVAREHARKRHLLGKAASDFFFQNHCYVYELADAMSANKDIMDCAKQGG